MHKKAAWVFGVALLVSPILVSADQISDLQAQIQSLLAQIGMLQGQSGQVAAETCISLSHNLRSDDTDAATNGEVSKLQEWLVRQPGTLAGTSIYPEARITGYFGPATMRAVQRWQAKHNIVSSGDPDSTGYGYVGRRTRAAIACALTNTYLTPAQTTIQVTYPQAGYVLENSGSKSGGQIATIQWNEQNGDYPVNIWLIDSSNQVVKGIAYSVPDVGSYSWSYDASLSDGIYQIRIDVMYPTGKGGQASASSGLFTIQRSPLSADVERAPAESHLVLSTTSGPAPLIVALKWFKDTDETAFVEAGDGVQGYILKALKRFEDGRECITAAYLRQEPSRCILVTTANTPAFTYRVPGTYTVTVKDKFGGTVLETKTITVR